MTIVKDEGEIVRNSRNVIEQGSQSGFGWRRLRGLESPQRLCANLRHSRLQSSHEVSHKGRGIVIPFVQRQPGRANLWYALLAGSSPFADHGGFPKSGRCRNEGQFAVQALVQPFDQPGARDNLRPGWGDIKFRG